MVSPSCNGGTSRVLYILLQLGLLLSLFSCGFLVRSPAPAHSSRGAFKRSWRLAGALKSEVDQSRAYVKQCDVMIVVPLLKLKLEILPSLQKKLPSNAKSSVLSKKALIEALDSSPYVQAVPDLSDSTHLAIFSKGEVDSLASKDAVFKWWKQLGDERPSNILICFKTHYLNLQYEAGLERGGPEAD